MKKFFPIYCFFFLQIVSCHFGEIESKPEATKFSIKNNSIVLLQNVIWNGTDFGDISLGGVSEREVLDGWSYVFFQANGKQYYTERLVFAEKHKRGEFPFINETLVIESTPNATPILLKDVVLNAD